MYGDCHVMSNIAGNLVSTETLFSSTNNGKPHFNFMSNMPFRPFPPIIPKEESGGLIMLGKDEMESGSGSEVQVEDKSVNEQECCEQLSKKKRYHRHTQHQIQVMESMFEECPHPDDKQRMKLSQDLGLKPRQVKFWFQNRRTQMKAKQDRVENIILRAENESLKNDNYRLQEELSSLVCPNCGEPAMLGGISFEELRFENARLREELERASCISLQYGGRPIKAMELAPQLVSSSLDLDMNMNMNMYSRQLLETLGTCAEMMPVPMLSEASSFPDKLCPVLMEEEKALAMELAISSMDELVKMCRATEPLWIRNNENGKEVLNLGEHARIFPWPLNLKRHSSELRTEATRDTAVVIMNSITLVDSFLDVNKWMELFPSIVTKAKILQVVSHGVSGASGSLHLMYGELQVLSPLVPTREAYFLRFCQQNVEEGTWAIVDFPIDSFHDNIQSSVPFYRRRPSGCVIQDMPNGYSRVTWIEHAEIEEQPIHHIFDHLLSSGMAFGAHRWLSVLQRQCERDASLRARNISDLGVIPTLEARENVMRLAQRMMRTFCSNMSTSNGQSWTALSDSPDDTVRITTRKMTEPGQPNGIILSVVSTTWLPHPHHKVFDLLRDEHRRSQLDVLSNGNALHEVAHIANGSHPGNCISLLRIDVASNSSQHVELMLQESCTDQSGSLVVYTTIDVNSIQLAMNGEDPSCIPLLPLGFVIVPMESFGGNTNSTSSGNDVNEGNSISMLRSQDGNNGQNIPSAGCLLTVGLQVLASTIPSAKINLSTVNAINTHLCNTVNQINAALTTATTPTTCRQTIV